MVITLMSYLIIARVGNRERFCSTPVPLVDGQTLQRRPRFGAVQALSQHKQESKISLGRPFGEEHGVKAHDACI